VVELSSGACQSRVKWWRRPDLVPTEVQGTEDVLREERYLFGRYLLCMKCEDTSFSRRFRDIFSECSYDAAGDGDMPRLDLRVRTVRSSPDVLAVSLVPNLIDGVDFVRQLLPERQYLECTGLTPNWRMLALPEAPHEPVFAFGPSAILVSRSHPWQHMVAMYAISNAFRLQPDIFVFHAASVAVGGKGVFLFGNRGAGKTTLSLCLASRGHAFLGDEWGAVSTVTSELLPLRRVVSIRQGPQADNVDEYLRNHLCDGEILPDGTGRVRAKVGAMFPHASARIVPLTHAFFLRRFAARPAVEQFARNGAELPQISPLLGTIWGHSPSHRALELLRTLGKARWWHLDVGGSPEETAELVEETVKEGLWD
jgi:hypothetical protein